MGAPRPIENCVVEMIPAYQRLHIKAQGRHCAELWLVGVLQVCVWLRKDDLVLDKGRLTYGQWHVTLDRNKDVKLRNGMYVFIVDTRLNEN
jgi:hypothetical protein